MSVGNQMNVSVPIRARVQMVGRQVEHQTNRPAEYVSL